MAWGERVLRGALASEVRLLVGSLLTFALVGFSSLSAADVERIVHVPLSTNAYTVAGADGGTYYKYGILLGIGGGAPQLFEFDTGGDGFYAAYQEGAPWWRTFSIQGSTPFAKKFGSGLSYYGRSVEASIDFYSHKDRALAFSTGSTVFKVGQADRIEDQETPLWPTPDPDVAGSAPVERYFYGDFGLSLKSESSGIENVLAQLTYGNGVTKGYKVSLGPYGSTHEASLQIGLDQSDLTNPNTIWFAMTNGAEVITSTVTFGYGEATQTFANLGINMDTGNPTPGIDYRPADASLFAPFSEFGSLSQLLTGATMVLDAFPAPPAEEPLRIFSLTAGTERGVNQVYLKERSDGGPTYLNIGAPVFQQYDVTYDLENGLLGLTPIPEPSGILLSLAALAALVGVRLFWRICYRVPEKYTVRNSGKRPAVAGTGASSGWKLLSTRVDRMKD
jgi:hypothetical protein